MTACTIGHPKNLAEADRLKVGDFKPKAWKLTGVKPDIFRRMIDQPEAFAGTSLPPQKAFGLSFRHQTQHHGSKRKSATALKTGSLQLKMDGLSPCQNQHPKQCMP
ncbi:hypothetical protein WH96_00640 [Kiloniella spongiae]|uniref:Uncharacterized protein n=1 Tax=Kiloniella spongiae TaxID=1489064 RepID=A0A0H2MZK2_9PROT|nr:hypothetical protein [Kiloniella spongiae]KLN62085.1 hypothetical protein WH96_00640 [Kiloniella spongiae]